MPQMKVSSISSLMNLKELILMLIIPFARQRLNLLLRIAESPINCMLAGLTAGRCLSWCVNGFFAYIIVAIIANEIIFLESFRLMLRQRTPNMIVSFICH